MSGTSQITPRGQLTSFCLKTARGGGGKSQQNNLSCIVGPGGGDGGGAMNGTYIKQTAKQLSVFY